MATIMNDMVKLSEALEQLPISRSTLKRLIQAGKIEGVRIGKQWFIHRDEIGRIKREGTRGGQT